MIKKSSKFHEILCIKIAFISNEKNIGKYLFPVAKKLASPYIIYNFYLQKIKYLQV